MMMKMKKIATFKITVCLTIVMFYRLINPLSLSYKIQCILDRLKQSRSYKIQVCYITHHALHNTFHILHMILRLDKVLRIIMIVLFKTKPSQVYQIFFDENQDLNNTYTQVKQIIIQIKLLMMKSNIFNKLGFCEKKIIKEKCKNYVSLKNKEKRKTIRQLKGTHIKASL